jgi:serine/threonine-protein kinase
MGAVYRATDQVLQRAVAIKVLKDPDTDEVGKQIRVEAQILARLLHDNVVRIYDFGEANGTYYLVMEEVNGPSFSKRWRHLPLLERLGVIAQVSEALDYAHHQGVIHRDVKPGNVLLTSADQAKLSDFGLSKLAEQADESGTVRGTPHYMSPEQAKGKPLDHRTDLYAVGVMLYECATGATPFSGPVMAVLSQQINVAPTPPRERNKEITPSLEALILSLLAKDRESRPPSGTAVAERLRQEIDDQRAGRARSVAAQGAKPPSDAIAHARTITVETPHPVAAPAAGGPAQSPNSAKPAEPVSQPRPSPALRVPAGVSPLARILLDSILADPVVLSPQERYLTGHYLAYLMGGSRRQGLLMRRPLDPRNADRARLMLAMTSAMLSDGSDSALACSADLLERRPEARASLNPVVVMKYIASRDTSAKRKRFRNIRQSLLALSPYAQKFMTDATGMLNPGMMPQTLSDLTKIAPERTEVDDQLVSRWNRVTEVWRDKPDFRRAVLQYATKGMERDPATADLWPEVVYPLIERARWQRQFRSRYEAIWDYLSAQILHAPVAGVRLDRAIQRSVPAEVVEELNVEAIDFAEDPEEEDRQLHSQDEKDAARLSQVGDNGVSLHEIASERAPGPRSQTLLIQPDPRRFTQAELKSLWEEAIAGLRTPGTKTIGHRHIPIGPYRLAVVPTVRGRSAGEVVIQGMRDKQIEMLTPSLRLGGSATKPIVAVWVYQDNSLVISYLDFQNSARYILWHAPNAHQNNFDDAGDLNHALLTLSLEVPDQVDRVLTKRYRPAKPV